MTFVVAARSLFEILQSDVAALKAEPNSVRHGMHAAILAAHFVERVFEENTEIQATFNKMSAYRGSLENREPSLRKLRDVCNLAKHTKITLYTPKVSKIDIKNVVDKNEVGQAIAGVSAMSMVDEDLALIMALNGKPRLLATLQDGSTEDLLELLQSAVKFWDIELISLGL